MSEVQQAKQEIREQVWRSLEAARVVQPGVQGHIPDFTGAEQAASRLSCLDIWRDALVVQAVPDRAQYPVRVRALSAGKLLYMAVPRLARAHPFYVLDPCQLTVGPEQAADAAFAASLASTVDASAMRPVDLVVCGSVVVNRVGVRLGKGAGYSDTEMAILADAGLLTSTTVIVTTVHPLQLIDSELPEEDHDFRVDLIITPDAVITCGPSRRPRGPVAAS